LPETKEGEVDLRTPAARRASGMGAGLRREDLELVERVTGEESGGGSMTTTSGLMKPSEFKMCCEEVSSGEGLSVDGKSTGAGSSAPVRAV